jgi:hypothetical protein
LSFESFEIFKNLFLKDGKYQEEIIAQLAQHKLSGEDMRKEMQEKLAPLTENWRQETVKELNDLLIKTISV